MRLGRGKRRTEWGGQAHGEAHLVLRPQHDPLVHPPKRFLANASLALLDGELVATDAKGNTRRFPLSGESGAPAALGFIKDLHGTGGLRGHDDSAFAVLDGNGEQIASSPDEYWSQIEAHRFADAAGLRFESIWANTHEEWKALPRKRNDCFELDAFGWPQALVVVLAILTPVGLAFFFGGWAILVLAGEVTALLLWDKWAVRRARKKH